jgi:hypothetical protein
MILRVLFLFSACSVAVQSNRNIIYVVLRKWNWFKIDTILTAIAHY